MLFHIIWMALWVTTPTQVHSQSDTLPSKKIGKKDSLSLIIDKRPRNAFVLGVVLPGAGQVYNKRWLKLPFAYGAYVGMYYYMQFTRDQYKEWNGYYQTAVATGMEVEVRPDRLFNAKQIKIYRDKFRDDKDVALFLTIGVHFVIALEAYVDAHLKNFNISEDLSFKAFPDSKGLGLAYALH